MKWLFLWKPPAAADLLTVRERDTLWTALRDIRAVTAHLTEERTPRLSIVPFSRRALAMVTVRGDAANREHARSQLQSLGGSLAGYAVDESTPIPRERTWRIGERAPGACMLTIFRKSPRCDRERFFSEWHGRHTPMAMKIHPTIGYTRNVVTEIVVPGSPTWDGLVTEDFRTSRDVVEPLRLFGGALRAIPNMVRVGLHVPTFLEMRSLENHLVAEYTLAD